MKSKVQSMQESKHAFDKGKIHLAIIIKGRFLKSPHTCFQKAKGESQLGRYWKIYNVTF